MRSKRSILSTALASLLLVTTTAQAGTAVLHKGDPAPFDGLLLDETAASQTVNDVSANAAASKEIDVLKQSAVMCSQQTTALQAALDLADKRDQMRQQIEDRMMKTLEMDERAFALTERAAKVSIEAAEQSNAALQKMQEKVDAANRRSLWSTLVGAVVGLFVGPGLSLLTH